MQYSEMLKKYRLQHALTTAELASLLNTSEALINQIESGTILTPGYIRDKVDCLMTNEIMAKNDTNQLLDLFHHRMTNEFLLSKETTKLKEQLDSIIEQTTNRFLLYKFAILRANYYRKDNRLSETHRTLDKIKEEVLDYPELLFYYYKTLGMAYYFEGKYAQAKDMFILAEVNIVDDKVLVADFYYNFALIFAQLYRTNEAINHLKKAIHIYKEIGNTKKLCWCYSLMATCYSRADDLNQAEEFHLMALAVAKEQSYHEFTGKILHNLASLEERRNNLKKANEYYKKSLLLAESQKDYDHISQTTYVIAKYYRNIDDRKNALKYIERGLRWCEMAPNENNNVMTFKKQLVALKLSVTKEWEMYEEKVKELIELFSLHSYRKAYLYAEELANHYVAQGKTKLAAYYFELASEFKNKIGNSKD